MDKNQEIRRICYDRDLHLESYQLLGVLQKFPNHFHEYYVIGYMETGKRNMWCKEIEYNLSSGDMVLFGPMENHYCAPVDEIPMDYRALNVPSETMQKAFYGITGRNVLPYFTKHTEKNSVVSDAIMGVYQAVQDNQIKQKKEEKWQELVRLLIQEKFLIEEEEMAEENRKIDILCDFIEANYQQNLTLENFAAITQMSKSNMNQKFTKEKGVTPYRYLQTIRIGHAKRLLENGMEIAEVSQETGFTDQSHFTNFFKSFIGITPKQYRDIYRKERKQK